MQVTNVTIEQVTPEVLLLLVGFLQSLFFEYVPGVAPWYAKRDEVQKRGIQALLLFLITILVFALACTSILESLACDQNTAITLFITWILALMANQTGHRVFKKRSS